MQGVEQVQVADALEEALAVGVPEHGGAEDLGAQESAGVHHAGVQYAEQLLVVLAALFETIHDVLELLGRHVHVHRNRPQGFQLRGARQRGRAQVLRHLVHLGHRTHSGRRAADGGVVEEQPAMAGKPPVASIGEGLIIECLVTQHLVVPPLRHVWAPDDACHLRLPRVHQEDPLSHGVVCRLRQVQAVSAGDVAFLEPEEGVGRRGDRRSALLRDAAEEHQLRGAAADGGEERDGRLHSDLWPVLTEL
mmetsp:Transcript_74394/g.218116  ORF Transcript_74394/g.218116 Transcript_74394/m.218116 type:complete len:249 (+) Transcript_74394:431-1177(+)